MLNHHPETCKTSFLGSGFAKPIPASGQRSFEKMAVVGSSVAVAGGNAAGSGGPVAARCATSEGEVFLWCATIENLVQVIREECKVHPRQLLSAHTTMSCRLKEHKTSSPCISLHDCGIDDIVDGEIRISLPHSFMAGDGASLEHRQPVAAGMAKKTAQGEACVQILAKLLAKGPQAVILAHGALRNGAASAAAIRAAATQCNQIGGAIEPFMAVATPSAVLQDAVQIAQERGSGRVPLDPVVQDPAAQPERDRECVEALLHNLWPGVWYSPGELPRAWHTLAKNLPKGTFWEFLERHPDKFEAWGKQFRIIAPQRPVAPQPVAQQPVAQQPVAQQPVAHQPVAQQPVAQQPVAQQPVAQQQMAQHPVAQQPVAPPPGLPPVRTWEQWEELLGDDRRLIRPPRSTPTPPNPTPSSWQEWTWRDWQWQDQWQEGPRSWQ